MGLTGFQNARRVAADKADVPAEDLSYDEAIAILAQPLLTPAPVVEGTPSIDLDKQPRKTKVKPKPEEA